MFNLGQDTENLITVNSRLLVYCWVCCCCLYFAGVVVVVVFFFFSFFFSPFYLTVLFVKVTLIDVLQFAMHAIPTICCKLFVNFQCVCYLCKIFGGLSLLDSPALMYFFPFHF